MFSDKQIELTEKGFTFILGGARSGKSIQAEKLMETLPAPWVYLATAQAFDDEMQDRIEHHRKRRDKNWVTVEAPLDLGSTLDGIADDQPVLIDCLTLWLTNIMLAGKDIQHETAVFLDAIERRTGPLLIVSNEVGLGIVPDNVLARQFRDEAGRLNQKIAASACRVVFMVSGLPMIVK